MLSGISSFLFGSVTDTQQQQQQQQQQQEVDVSLTTCQTDNEWLLVDRTDTVPVPVEVCPLMLHLDDSVINPSVSVVHRSLAEVRRPVSRGVTSRHHVTHVSQLITPTVTPPHLAWCRVVHGVQRKSLDRSNRVQERMSHCKQQRRYNYISSYSAQRNKRNMS